MAKPLFEVGDSITRSGKKLECITVSAQEDPKTGKPINFVYEFRLSSEMDKIREANEKARIEELRRQEEATEREALPPREDESEPQTAKQGE